MKNILVYTLSFVITIMILGGCFPASSSITQTVLPSLSPSSTSEKSSSIVFTATGSPNITPPPTVYLSPLLTPRVTPFSTITDANASKDLAYMLQTNGDCRFPCFFGIHPDQTRYEELYNVIDKLGGSRFETLSENGHIRVSSDIGFGENIGIQVDLDADLQDDIVKDLKVLLLNLNGTGVTSKDWSVYNMDEILKTYGPPDQAELYFSGPYNSLSFRIQLKYESIDTSLVYSVRTTEIAQYETPSNIMFCPEEIGVNKVELHVGKKPFNTIPDGVPILKATGVTEQDFHKLFTENPSACLTLNRNAFYP